MIRFLKSATVAALTLAALGAPGLPMFAAAPASAQADPAAGLDAVVAALRGITTMTADFTQTDRGGQALRGKLAWKQPGRIRFEYDKSVNMLIVANGASLTMIDYDVQQVQRWPIRNSPLGALLDPKRDIKRFGSFKPTANPDVLSIEVRDARHPEYGTITLIFTRNAAAPGGLELASWVALDSQNQRTTIRLSNQRYGMALPASAFTWRDPRPRSRR
jgi:outer membrane lipoprotein-sorting protein